MPTILINTNVSAHHRHQNNNIVESSSVDACREKHDRIDDDFKQDLNSIISKLLAKSETMDSFLIKYDIDDVMLKNSNKSNLSSQCICARLANLFNGILNKTESTDLNKTPPPPASKSELADPSQTEITAINNELKMIKKYQMDLSNKFNLIIKQLNNNSNSNAINNVESQKKIFNNTFQADSYFNNETSLNRMRKRVTSNLLETKYLSGAKKRKFFSHVKNSKEQMVAAPDDGAEDDEERLTEDNEENLEIDQDEIEYDEEIDEYEKSDDLEKEVVDNEAKAGAEEQQPSRSCPSRLSSATTTSSSSTTSKTDKKNQVQIIESNDEENIDNLKNSSLSEEDNQPQAKKSHSKAKNKQLNECDEEFITELDVDNENNNTCDEDEFNSEQIDEAENKTLDDYYDPVGNENRQDKYSGHPNASNTVGAYQHSIQQNRSLNALNNNMYGHSMQNTMPQRFRFMNPSQQQQSYYSHPHSQPIFPRSSVPSLRGLPVRTAPRYPTFHQNYSNTNRPQLFMDQNQSRNNYSQSSINDEQKAKTPSSKSSQNSKLELTPSSNNNGNTFKSEMTADIDINELFNGDGPRFLQMELYKDFKPPIALIKDKYFIDNILASSAYSKSKSRRNFAAHLAKLVFTPRERLESNCNGRFGKKALDTTRLMAIRNTLFQFYPCKSSTLLLNGEQVTSGDHDENNVWLRDCIPAIDESNRVLKKQLISWYKKNRAPNATGTSAFLNSTHSPTNMKNDFDSFSNASNYDATVANGFDASGCLNDDEQLEEDYEINI